MNKTLMLVICDFLLLSMLALARFDPPEETPKATLDATASDATAEAELIALLEESLQAEQGSRENLSSDLTETRENLQEKARLLAEREAQLEETLANLEMTAEEAAELAASKAAIEEAQAELQAERDSLAERFEETREQLEKTSEERIQMADTLGQLKEERSVTDERLKQAQEALRLREIELAQRETQLRALEKEKEQLASTSEELNRELQVTQAQKSLLESNLEEEQAEKAVLQKEKEEAFARAERLTENVSELGQNVTTLAQSSEAIREEIEASRPQTTSEIFTRFQNNRATVRFISQEQALLRGQTERIYESKSILIRDPEGTTFLVTHSNNTPFAFSKTANLDSVSLEVQVGSGTLPIQQIGFLATDPRLVFIPLPKIFVDSTGLETFDLALQPERWEEAVLVKDDESNFGRTEFRRITSSDRFLKMDRPALGELFADFASSRGDLAFTKNSQFIGLMTDTDHAVVIDEFLAAAVIDLGAAFDPLVADETVGELRSRVRSLPSEVQ